MQRLYSHTEVGYEWFQKFGLLHLPFGSVSPTANRHWIEYHMMQAPQYRVFTVNSQGRKMFSQLQMILGLMTFWDIIIPPFFTYLIFKHSIDCQRSLNLLAKQSF